MFPAGQLIRAERWKHPKYLPIDIWINKMWSYPYNGTLFSHKKEVLAHTATGINLEHKMLCERRQAQKTIHCMISFKRNVRIGKSIKTVYKWLPGSGDWGWKC